MAISSLLGIAQRALLASETALGVVGNNIANVNTPGYTRQVPDLESDPSSATAQGVLVGTGVHVAAVRQVLDPLLEKRLIGAETERRQQGAVRDQLSALASVLNELDQPSLGDAVDGFFAAADALARNPGGAAERETLLGQARTLADQLQQRSAAVAALQRGADDAYVAATTRANDALGRIADLNRAITAAEAGGERANDLRDRRRTALTDLARAIGAALSTDPGDNQNALNLADLRTRTQAALGKATFSGYLADLTGAVGEGAARARDTAQASEALQQQLQNQRDSFSGVNLNEELSNLLRYQRAFQASAEAMNVANQILDELMSVIR